VAVFEAILFDNDGVLVDTERLYYAATRQVLAGIGVELDESAYVELFLRQGVGAWHLAEERGLSPAVVSDLRAARDRRYLDLLHSEDVTMPGVADLVAGLAQKFRLAVVTSSHIEPFVRTHARTGLLAHFEFALTRGDYLNSKPAPEPYLRAMERLHLSADRCLVIEDSERGLRAAKAAGLTCWIIPSPLTATSDFSAADAILPSLADAVARLSR
jgi:HAD superfamily hydrolase (TIGR01509 family)